MELLMLTSCSIPVDKLRWYVTSMQGKTLYISEWFGEADGADAGDGRVHVVLHVRDAAAGALREQEVRDRDVLQPRHGHLHRHHIQPLPQEEPGGSIF